MTMSFQTQRRLVFVLFAFSVVATYGCRSEPEVAADLVLLDGKVVTVDENVPEGQAIAIRIARRLPAPAVDRNGGLCTSGPPPIPAPGSRRRDEGLASTHGPRRASPDHGPRA